VKTVSAPFSPSARSLALFDHCVGKIVPDDATLASWFERYARHHRHRIALDMDLIERYAPRHAKIVELGSTPLLFTVPLARLQRDVIGIDLHPERYLYGTGRRRIDVPVFCQIQMTGGETDVYARE
jgi:hypothetical protein